MEAFLIFMEGKKSFLLYCDIVHTVRKLTREQKGDLFTMIIEYVNDTDPIAPDPLTDIIFEPIKQQLKRDLEKWKVEIDRDRKNGKKGAKKRWAGKKEDSPPIATHSPPIANDALPKPPIAKIADSVSVSDNVNDNVIVIENEKILISNSDKSERDIFLQTFNEFRTKYPGTKKGNETEFANFCKKHKDWKKIIPSLKSQLESQIKSREVISKKHGFLPQWKILGTYINGRHWEDEIPTENIIPINKEKSNAYYNNPQNEIDLISQQLPQ